MKETPTIIFVSTSSFFKELKEYYNPAIPWFIKKRGRTCMHEHTREREGEREREKRREGKRERGRVISIPLCGYNIIYLTISLLMDTTVFPNLSLLRIMLQKKFLNTRLHTCASILRINYEKWNPLWKTDLDKQFQIALWRNHNSLHSHQQTLKAYRSTILPTLLRVLLTIFINVNLISKKQYLINLHFFWYYIRWYMWS